MQGFFPRVRRLGFLLLIFASLCAGCGAPAALQSPAVAPPPDAAPTILPTVTLAPPVTATATATDRPTATLAPTITATATPVPPPALDPALAAELQAILDRLVADGFIPGAVLAVHVPGYALWAGASGVVDRESAQPISPDTRMRIASITKIFTAVVVLQLAEEGRIDLDTPLSVWYPDLVPRAREITPRRLLGHTTGLHDYLEDHYFLGKAYQKPDYRWPPAELAAYAGKQPFLFEPGARDAWDYSSTNFVILGMVVEAVTGNSLAEEMRARIFTPLGMEATSFVPDDEVEGVYARGYRNDADVTDVSLSFAYATANIVSTVTDLQRFGQALFGGALLGPEAMEQMLSFQSGKGQYRMPDLEYGLGLMRNKLSLGPDAEGGLRPAELRTVIGHTGGFGGFRSVLWYAPASGILITLGENQGATDPNILATSALDAALRAQGQ